MLLPSFPRTQLVYAAPCLSRSLALSLSRSLALSLSRSLALSLSRSLALSLSRSLALSLSRSLALSLSRSLALWLAVPVPARRTTGVRKPTASVNLFSSSQISAERARDGAMIACLAYSVLRYLTAESRQAFAPAGLRRRGVREMMRRSNFAVDLAGSYLAPNTTQVPKYL